MKNLLALLTGLTGAVLLTGCGTTLPPGAERGPHNTMAYDVLIEASEPGARIEANGEDLGNSPVHLKIFGDPDGTFHDFGSFYYEVRAYPVTTNQFEQTRWFQTGHLMTPEDRIPKRIYFDMSRPAPAQAQYPPNYQNAPGPYYYGPGPYYYGPDYYGPDFRFYIGPRRYYRRY